MAEHCVQVFLKLTSETGSAEERECIAELTDKISDAIENAEVGEYDGDEYGEGVCRLFMYGPDADKLFEAVKELLVASVLSRDAYAIKRYGGASEGDAKEVRVDL